MPPICWLPHKGYINPAGKPEFAYLTELSVNYSAGLKKLAEVCELTGNHELAKGYRETADRITIALPLLMDDKGSFIMSLDPDGTRHAKGWFHGRFPFDIVYDCWGAPGGLLRGLFEYDYHSDGLRIRPHLPPDIARFTQKWPVMFGNTQIYISVTGTGPVKSAFADGEALPVIDGWIELKPDGTPCILSVEILRGDAKPRRHWKPDSPGPLKLPEDKDFWQIPENANQDNRHVDLKNIYLFYNELIRAGFKDSYEAGMARVSLELLSSMNERIKMLKDSSLIIPDLSPVLPCDNDAVNLNYFEKARFIAGGLVDRLKGYSIWNEHSDPEIVAIAHKINLIK